MKKVTIKLYKSAINSTEKQKNTLRALGLRRINQSVGHKMTPQLKGMINKVQHLVEVQGVQEEE